MIFNKSKVKSLVNINRVCIRLKEFLNKQTSTATIRISRPCPRRSLPKAFS
jgi:hypothetical protein